MSNLRLQYVAKHVKAVKAIEAYGFKVIFHERPRVVGREHELPINSPEQLVTVANRLVYNQAIEDTLNDHREGNFFDFFGSEECASTCEGWDGKSQKCQCGHCEVHWTYCGDFEHMEIFAMRVEQ